MENWDVVITYPKGGYEEAQRLSREIAGLVMRHDFRFMDGSVISLRRR